MLVRPALHALSGRTDALPPLQPARLEGRVRAKPASTFASYAQVRLVAGRLVARPLGNQCSALTRSASDADGFILVPPGEQTFETVRPSTSTSSTGPMWVIGLRKPMLRCYRTGRTRRHRRRSRRRATYADETPAPSTITFSMHSENGSKLEGIATIGQRGRSPAPGRDGDALYENVMFIPELQYQPRSERGSAATWNLNMRILSTPSRAEDLRRPSRV